MAHTHGSQEVLAQFEHYLQESLQRYPLNQDPLILRDAAAHLCVGSGSKRARPQLVFFFGEALGLVPAELMDVALAAELIHAASLLHDDVVDEGYERRGRPTVNARWSNTVAVLGGDAVLCMALMGLGGRAPVLTRLAVELVSDMTRATMWEVEARGRIDFSLSDWRRMAEGKTGILFGWCGRAVSLVAGQESLGEAFDRCGRHLGVAFQLADDVQDLVGAGTGKEPLADIYNRNPSFPLIWAMQRDGALAGELGALWDAGEMDAVQVAHLGTRVLESGALGHACVAIREELARAMAALGDVAYRPGGEQIAEWADKLGRIVEEIERGTR